jgi:hypothetical protein
VRTYGRGGPWTARRRIELRRCSALRSGFCRSPSVVGKVDTDRYPVRSRSLARRGPSFGASVRAGRVSDAAATVGVPSAESTCSDGRAVPARRRCFATGVRHWRDASRRSLRPLNESDLTLLVRFEWNLEAAGEPRERRVQARRSQQTAPFPRRPVARQRHVRAASWRRARVHAHGLTGVC